MKNETTAFFIRKKIDLKFLLWDFSISLVMILKHFKFNKKCRKMIPYWHSFAWYNIFELTVWHRNVEPEYVAVKVFTLYLYFQNNHDYSTECGIVASMHRCKVNNSFHVRFQYQAYFSLKLSIILVQVQY